MALRMLVSRAGSHAFVPFARAAELLPAAAMPLMWRPMPSASLHTSIGAAVAAARGGICSPRLGRMSRRLSAVAAGTELIKVLQQELDYEHENYAQPELLASTPKGWKLSEEVGDTHMALRKEQNGEKIEVHVSVNEQDEGDEVNEELEAAAEAAGEGPISVDVGVVFNVHVAKGETALVFECRSDGTYLEVQHVSLEPFEKELPDSHYDGPVYYELDDALQAAFKSYLEERGINAELGAYVLTLVSDKEQREYVRWLGRVKEFVQ